MEARWYDGGEGMARAGFREEHLPVPPRRWASLNNAPAVLIQPELERRSHRMIGTRSGR